MHIPGRRALSAPCDGRREKTAQYTGTPCTMQGKCLINRRILTGLAASVALKNCKYQLQNFELFTVLCTGLNLNPALQQRARRGKGSDVQLCSGFLQVFLQLSGRNWKMPAGSAPAFSPVPGELRIVRILPALTEYQLNRTAATGPNRAGRLR